MIGRVVTDRPGDVLLLQAADAMLASRRSRNNPRPRQGFRISAVGRELSRAGHLVATQIGQVVRVYDPPRLGTIRQEAVRQEHDGRHVLDGQANRLERHRKAIGGRGRGQDRQRTLAVPAVHDGQQIGLFRLGGHARTRPRALHVDNDQRQFGHYGKAQGFGLEREARPARAGCSDRTSERRADRGAASGDFVLGLERPHVVFLVLRQLVQNLTGRCNRIARIDQCPPGAIGGGDQTDRGGLVARNPPVSSLGQPGRRHRVLNAEQLGRVGKVVTGPQTGAVGGHHGRVVSQLLHEPFQHGLKGTIVQPQAQPESEEVLAREASLRGNCMCLTASSLSLVMATGMTRNADSSPLDSGLEAYSALDRLAVVNSSSFTTTMPPGCKSGRLTFKAAGFIAIRT